MKYLEHGDGKRVTKVSIRRDDDTLIVAEQVTASDVMQLGVDPEQQVAIIVYHHNTLTSSPVRVVLPHLLY